MTKACSVKNVVNCILFLLPRVKSVNKHIQIEIKKGTIHYEFIVTAFSRNDNDICLRNLCSRTNATVPGGAT